MSLHNKIGKSVFLENFCKELLKECYIYIKKFIKNPDFSIQHNNSFPHAASAVVLLNKKTISVRKNPIRYHFIRYGMANMINV